MKCANSITFCRAQMMPCTNIGHEESCPYYSVCGEMEKGKTPSFAMTKAMYVDFHRKEGRIRTESHQRAVILEVDRFMRHMSISDSDPVDMITPDSMEKYVSSMSVKPVTKIGICARLRAFLGRNERDFYRKRGFDVKEIRAPYIRDDTKAYTSVRTDQMMRVMTWYRSLQFRKDPRERIFAMMMFRYAMRNGDVERLKWKNFHTETGMWQLDYVPHKTEKSANGRSVKIWLNPMDQIELSEFRGNASDDDFVIPRKVSLVRSRIKGMKNKLNDEMRGIGFNGSKGLYELRKMCVDRVYHLYGAEAASAYSGDDFDTVKFNYCDVSSLNLHGLGDEAFVMQAMRRAA